MSFGNRERVSMKFRPTVFLVGVPLIWYVPVSRDMTVDGELKMSRDELMNEDGYGL